VFQSSLGVSGLGLIIDGLRIPGVSGTMLMMALTFWLVALVALAPALDLWELPAKVLDAKRMAAVVRPRVVHPWLYLLLGSYFIQADLNEVWAAARKKNGHSSMEGASPDQNVQTNAPSR
jgi:hypothetical protein